MLYILRTHYKIIKLKEPKFERIGFIMYEVFISNRTHLTCIMLKTHTDVASSYRVRETRM